MQARSQLDSVKWRQKCPQRIVLRQKIPHPTHKVSDGSGVWLQCCCPVLSACSYSAAKSGGFPRISATTSKICEEHQALKCRIHIHKNHSIPRSTSLSTKIAHPKCKTTSPWPFLTTTWKQQQKALQIANCGGGNGIIMHQMSEKTEAAQRKSSGPGKSGAKRYTPRILVDVKVTFSRGWLFFFLKTRANFFKELEAVDYSMYTHQKSLQSEVVIPLHENTRRVHYLSFIYPDHYLKKLAQGLPDRESRRSKSNLEWNFKEKKKVHKTKLQTLLFDKVPTRYGLESFLLVHTHSHMSSLDYFEITSFPNLFPQLSKNDFDMFLLDHREILDESVCASLNLFCHDQHSNVSLHSRKSVDSDVSCGPCLT